MFMVKSVTTSKRIRVSIDTHKSLKALGRKGESFDAVIRRLIKIGKVAELEIGAPLLQDLLDIEEEVKD